MPGGEETCTGLMWLAGAATSWTCVSDTHVFNVRLGPPEGAQRHRPGLKWVRFRNAADPAALVYVQVREEAQNPTLSRLEINGRACVLVPID